MQPVATSAASEDTPAAGEPWLTPGVRGIGTASFLADLGHEIPTALLPSFLTVSYTHLTLPTICSV